MDGTVMFAKLDTVAEGEPDAERLSDAGAGGRWRRAGVAALGGGLVAAGLRRRSLGGAAAALVGGLLAYRAVGGRNRLRRALGRRENADPVTVSRSVTVGEPAEELTERLRDPETLARVVGGFADVAAAGENRQRWTVEGPMDRSRSWETRLVEDADEGLRWEAVDDGALFEEWSASFEPAAGDRGTRVTFRVAFDPPGGRLGDAALKRLGVAPEVVVAGALDRFKSLVETGTIPTLEENPSARGRGDLV